MQKNLFSNSLFSLVGGTLGALLIGVIFVTMSNVLAAPTVAPPDGNPPFPQDGATGPAGEDGESAVIAVHSQTTGTPNCPSGWTQLWNGYSYVGSANEGGHSSGMDLGDPGSCLQAPMYTISPILECWEGSLNCNVNTSSDYTWWLSATSDPAFASSSLSSCVSAVSRCSVCEKPTSVVVQHSRTTGTPSCPSGYSSMWTGYSLIGASGGAGFNVIQSMNSPGSCLSTFRRVPLLETWGDSSCNYITGGDSAMWLQATTGTNPSRCNVCEKI